MTDQFKFLNVVSLPAYQGLALAATAVRALELFSDLVDGQKPPAPLAEADRFDIMDECLDLVVLRNDLPAGFEFTGLTMAELWEALKAAPMPPHELELWHRALDGTEMQALRAAGRQRVKVLPDSTFLRSSALSIPDCITNAVNGCRIGRNSGRKMQFQQDVSGNGGVEGSPKGDRKHPHCARF